MSGLSYLEAKGLVKDFGDFRAVNNVTLEVEQGEMIALLGASGCGKTTILRMVAGFCDPTEGEILIGGEKVNHIPPYKRNVGIFFQNYALFPHMTTYDNVAFSLKMKKAPKQDIQKKVGDILSLVKLEGLEDRYPREMSGGQQQRVALARALVMEPSVLLLDEPLSNLDAKLRAEMQLEIKKIQRKLGVTTIIVTHDQEEAVSLADQIIVMNQGQFMQRGGPKEVFDHPANRFVADFMGFTNFIDGTVQSISGGAIQVEASGRTIPVLAGPHTPEVSVGMAVTLTIRPENILLAEPGKAPDAAGTVQDITYKGNVTRLDVGGAFDETLHVHLHEYDGGGPSERVELVLPADKLVLFAADTK